MTNKSFKYLIVILLTIANTAAQAQTPLSFEEFRGKVLNYSQQIKQSVAQQEAMQSAVKLAKSAFMPAVDAGGSYQYRINSSELDFGSMAIPLNHNSFSAEIGVLQPIYSGGAIKLNHEVSQIQSEIAEKSVELTTENILFAIETSYWGATAQKAMYETMCEYVEIISQLKNTIQSKYDDGMVAKTELIQMQSRLKEAELQRSNTHLAYQLAIQNLNSLMGRDPLTVLELKDSVMTKMNLPKYRSVSEILDNRSDFAISKLDVLLQQKQVDLVGASYKPTLAVGLKESWGTQMINIDGSTLLNSNLYVSLKVPIFHGGASRHKQNMQRAVLNTKKYQMQDMEDKISKEVAKSWTELTENIKQLEIAKENCLLAEENLELNTFSYNEGRLQILDVLSSQINWIQSYTNLINSYYQQRVSHASYNKSIGVM